MHQRSIKYFIALLLVAGLIPAAQAAYRWVDDNGNVHYTQTKPMDRDAEYIEPLRSHSGSTKAETAGTPSAAPADEAAAAPGGAGKTMSEDEIQAAIDAVNKENCARARSNLAALTQRGNIRMRNEEGQLVAMPVSVRQQKIETARRQIEELCK